MIRGSEPRPAARGIALVLVLWVLALLTVMALALTQVQRTEGALTANQLDNARFRAHADGLLNLVALNLLSTPSTTFDDSARFWIPDGRPQPVQWDGERFILTLSNEGSKFDLNRIDQQQLRALIELAQGADHQDTRQRDQLADAILDWRDAGDFKRLHGATDADYAAAGFPYGAGNRPFRSVEELRQVLGMSASLYAGLAPYLTIEDSRANPYAAFSAGQGAGSGAARIDEAFAAAPVLVALHGYLLENAERVVEERFQGLFADDDDGRRAPLERGGPRYHVRITQQRAAGGGRSMEALIHVEPANPAAFEVLWRRFDATIAPSNSHIDSSHPEL